MSKVLGPAFDKIHRDTVVGTSWVRVLRANPARRTILFQNQSDAHIKIHFGGNPQSGFMLAPLSSGAAVPAGIYEVTSEHGNLSRQDVYALATGASKTLHLVISEDAITPIPTPDVSSSSSSDSSESSSSESSSSSSSQSASSASSASSPSSSGSSASSASSASSSSTEAQNSSSSSSTSSWSSSSGSSASSASSASSGP